MPALLRRSVLPLAFASFLFAACSDDGGGDGDDGGGTSGASGSSGTQGGGTSGSSGSSSGGSATGGASGSSGASTGGSAQGGTAQGGAAGAGGAGMTGGSAGAGTTGGSAGAGMTGGSAGMTGGSGGSGATVTGPRFIGRFTNDRRFAWSGATIALRFTGTSVSVTLTDTGDNFYDAVVDGGDPLVIDAMSGTRTYMIATDLANGPHEVRVTRRTEAFFNPSTFVSFSVPESAWLPQTVPNRRLEVIGDSISAGYGNEGMGPDCDFVPATENHSLTYEALAAGELGAELHTEAWSGIGVYRNNDGGMTGLMPERFLLTIPTESGTTWDFSKYQPHAVVVNLGTNDFAMGDPGMGFRTAQQNFAASLRMRYPDARIYLAVGPMLNGAQYAAALDYLEAVVTARRAAGDDAIDTIEFATDTGSGGFGCHYHPNEATHARMATTLVARLRADLGW
ncbi:MAG TPA: SGNH/GDSL hydrolase family protein [Polyangiaceae bacterium]